ncbi:MAG: CehA/McbA family metallohydrolase [Bacteroidota bacterium]|nr:CehA/McbA family metallohydrolase [Bacteroidota bacterium]
MNDLMYEYAGVIHIHSTYSDGTGDVPSIARAAAESGLDFIILTDHNTLKAKKEGWERVYKGVIILVGMEINDRNDRNHYLVVGLDSPIGARLSAEEYVEKVRERGGIGFLAHPDEQRTHMPEHPPYPWTAWGADGFDGLEIWNHMSEWMEGLTNDNKIQRLIHPLKSIIKPSPVTLRRWDDLCRLRPVAGVGGVDAHAHKADVYGFFDVEVFPYKVMFRSIRTYVLLDEPLDTTDPARFDETKWRIYRALRDGRSYIANVYRGDPRGFEFTATQNRRHFSPGTTLRFSPVEPIRLSARVPSAADLRIVRNGEPVAEVRGGMEIGYRVSDIGAYRFEAWKNGCGWIFANHIRITDRHGRC